MLKRQKAGFLEEFDYSAGKSFFFDEKTEEKLLSFSRKNSLRSTDDEHPHLYGLPVRVLTTRAA